MFGFYPSPYIVIVMLAAAGVSLPLLFWFTTRLLNLTPGKRVLVVATTATALLLLLSSSGPLLKVFSQDPEPPVVGAWTFETAIDPNPLETGSDAGATVTFRAIFTVDQTESQTPTALSVSITSDSRSAQAVMETNTDSGRIGLGNALSADPYLYAPGGSLANPSCDPDLEAGDDGEIKTTCSFDFLTASNTKVFARSGATAGSYNVRIEFPQAVEFTATATVGEGDSFTSDTISTSDTEFSSPELPLQVIFGQPANLSATPGDGQVTLAWTDPSNTNIAAYEYRTSNDAGNSWLQDWTGIVESSAATTSHTVTGLSNGTEYLLEVRAVNDSSQGAAASVTATPKTAPDNPENFRATVANGAVTLTWEAPVSNGGSAITNYQYRQSTDSGSTWNPEWTDVSGGASETSQNPPGLTDDTTYTFEVRATTNSEGAGDHAALKAALPDGPVITGPDVPHPLTSATGDSQAILNWSAPGSDGGDAITKYQYRQSIDGGATWDPDWTDVSSTSDHTVTGLANGTQYTLDVRAVNSVSVGNSARISAIPGIDYDDDDDGLIEVASLAQLNAMRWDLDGDGSSTQTGYTTAFHMPYAGMGCPSTGCVGYELTADLDFDTNGDDTVNALDNYWNEGSGWAPIGDGTNNFSATFHGNGHTISNLYISRPTTAYVGLFGYTDSSARVQNVGIVDASVTGGSDVGGLVGFNDGTITQSYSIGSISGAGLSTHIGGLVGINSGKVTTSYATSSVTGASSVGGLVGTNQDTVIASYATGTVTGTAQVGGLVGFHPKGAVTVSYATGIVTGGSQAGGLVGSKVAEATVTSSYWDTESSGQPTSEGGEGVEGKTTTDLRSPITYTGIYENWNVDTDGDDNADDPWDFGTDQQYPVLKVDFNDDNDATWQEFGNQRNPPGAPSITSIATEAANELTVVWAEPTLDGGSGITGYDLRYMHSFVTDKSDANWTVVPDVAGPDALQANITDLRGGYSHDVQVRAVNSIGQGQWSETSKGKPNEAPSVVQADFRFPVHENSPGGTDVGESIEAEDHDDDDVITFSMSDAFEGFFEIHEIRPRFGQVRVSHGTQLDFETQSEYVGQVCVDDGLGGRGEVCEDEADGSARPDTAKLTIIITNVNEAPEVVVVNRIQEQSMTAGTGSRSLSLSERFSDPENDNLTYSASSSNPSVVASQISGTSLTLTPVGPGSATVTVTATELATEGDTPLSGSMAFGVIVSPAPLPPPPPTGGGGGWWWRGPGPDPRTHTGANTRTYGDAGAYAHGDTRTYSGPNAGAYA